MSKLSPQLDAIRIKYDLSPTDFWELPQRKGTWIIKHAALEKVAAKALIVFDPPQVIEAATKDGIAVLSVQGSMYERVPGESDDGKGYRHELLRTWATGEATPANNKNQYPWAMAEKRAKDRVVLKLTGIEAYSEDEADDFKQNAHQSHTVASGDEGTPVSDSTAKLVFPALQSDLRGCATAEQLAGAWNRWLAVIVHWSDTMQQNCEDVRKEMADYLAEHAGDARSANREVIEADLRASVSEADLTTKWSGWGPAMKKLAPADVAKLQGVAREVKAAATKPASAATPDFTNLAPNDLDKAERMAKLANTP